MILLAARKNIKNDDFFERSIIGKVLMGILQYIRVEGYHDEEALSPHNCDFAPAIYMARLDICGVILIITIRSAVPP